MFDFWDRAWIVHLSMVEDYYRQREEQKNRWNDFCKKTAGEIFSECSHIADVLAKAAGRQSGSYVSGDLIKGVILLPLYGFHLVIGRQSKLSEEQDIILKQYFSTFDIPFSKQDYLVASKENNVARQSLYSYVGVSESFAGSFWVQFFKTLYRTDEDVSHIEEVINSFSAITMRFAALSGKAEDYLLEILREFLNSVHIQADKCREIPPDIIDFYGDLPFVEHYKLFKESTLRVCACTMDPNDEELNPDSFFRSFVFGLIYQILRRSTRSRADKVKMADDILAKIEFGGNVDGEYLFKYMEDLSMNESSMLAAEAHILTDLDKGNPAGWMVLSRSNGTYRLDKEDGTNTIRDASNFVIGMENYLVDHYPMSGLGKVAANYLEKALNFIDEDIKKNVTIV